MPRTPLVAAFLFWLPAIWTHDAATAGVDDVYSRPAGSGWTETFSRLIARDSLGKSYALVIGVGDYQYQPKLSAPAGDATRVRDFLRDEAGFDYIVTLTDEKATRSRIEELMERVFPTYIGPNDRFFFYFSGHGVTRTLVNNKRGYLVLRQARRDEWQEMIDMPRVRQWTENVAHARHALFVLDACFSGLAALEIKGGDARDRTIERLLQPGHHIITAGTEGEESYIFRGESLFTQAFLSAARGEGGGSSDGIVSLNDMMSRINRILDAKRAEIGERIKMTPRQYYSRIENNGGEFFFMPQRRRIPPAIGMPSPNPPSGTGIVAKTNPTEATPPLGSNVAVANRPAPDHAAISPAVSSAQSRGNSPFTVRSGVEAKGDESAPADFVSSIEDCEQRCARTTTCRVFTYGKSNRSCYLYSRAELVANAYFDSGSREAALLAPVRPSSTPLGDVFTMRNNMEAIGSPVDGSGFVNSLSQCKESCSRTAACKVFTYSSSARSCYLYSRADLMPNPYFDSGTRDAAALLPDQSRPTVSGGLFTIRNKMEATGKPVDGSRFVNSLSQCEESCARSAACRVFTYSSSARSCYLYSRADLVPNTHFDSGIRR
jgi:Caspase domain/PAN domain